MGDHGEPLLGSKTLDSLAVDMAGSFVQAAEGTMAPAAPEEAGAEAKHAPLWPSIEDRFLSGLNATMEEILGTLGDATGRLLQAGLAEGDERELSEAVAQMTTLWAGQALLEGRLLLKSGAPQAHAFNFKAMLEELVLAFGQLAGHRGLRFDFSYPERLPEWVKGDRQRIRCLLVHALIDSFAHVQAGTLGLWVSRGGGQDGRVRFDVIVGQDRRGGDGQTAAPPAAAVGQDKALAQLRREQIDGLIASLNATWEGGPATGQVPRSRLALDLEQVLASRANPTLAYDPANLSILCITETEGRSQTFEEKFGQWRIPYRSVVIPEIAPHPDAVTNSYQTDLVLAGILDELQFEAQRQVERRFLIVECRLPNPWSEALARAIRDEEEFNDLSMILIADGGVAGEEEADAVLAAGYDILLTPPLRPSYLLDAIVDCLVKGRVTSRPRQERESPAPPAQPVAAAAEPVVAFRARVLLVDDAEGNRLVAREILESLGCHVEEAEDGDQGLAAFIRGSFDAVLMDCDMPRSDGFEATRGIRQHEGKGRRTPIIAVTANCSDEDRQFCMSRDMDDFLGKPLDPKDLSRVLQVWIDPAKQVPVTS